MTFLAVLSNRRPLFATCFFKSWRPPKLIEIQCYSLPGRSQPWSLFSERHIASAFAPKCPIGLLVDADTHSIEDMKQAMSLLTQYGQIVSINIFAEPGRTRNSHWKTFINQHQMKIHEVQRSKSLHDPNDVAIMAASSTMAASSSVQTIALLVVDKDYAKAVHRIVSAGRKCLVILPHNRTGMARYFQKAEAEVIRMDQEHILPKMKAMLHADGNGSIQPIIEPFQLPAGEDVDEVTAMATRLQDLGYRSVGGDPLMPSLARFWNSNKLGDLAVWPLNFACDRIVATFSSRPDESWTASGHDLAFILPQSPPSGATKNKAAIAKYGTPHVQHLHLVAGRSF